MTKSCSNTWLTLKETDQQPEKQIHCSRFRYDVSNGNLLYEKYPCKKPTWTNWTPSTSACDHDCKRLWSRNCTDGFTNYRPSKCSQFGTNLEMRPCHPQDCLKSESIVNRKDQRDRNTKSFNYLSYWPGFVTGFIVGLFILLIALVSYKIYKNLKKRRNEIKRRALRRNFGKSNLQPWQIIVTERSQSFLKRATRESSQAFINSFYDTNSSQELSKFYNDKMFEKSSSNEIITDTSTLPVTDIKAPTPAPRTSIHKNRNSEKEVKLRNDPQRRLPIRSYLRINSDGDDDDQTNLPLVPLSYYLHLDEKKLSLAAAASKSNKNISQVT